MRSSDFLFFSWLRKRPKPCSALICTDVYIHAYRSTSFGFYRHKGWSFHSNFSYITDPFRQNKMKIRGHLSCLQYKTWYVHTKIQSSRGSKLLGKCSHPFWLLLCYNNSTPTTLIPSALHGDTGHWTSTWLSPLIDGEGIKAAVQMIIERIAALGLKKESKLPYKELRSMYSTTFNNYMRYKVCKYHQSRCAGNAYFFITFDPCTSSTHRVRYSNTTIWFWFACTSISLPW